MPYRVVLRYRFVFMTSSCILVCYGSRPAAMRWRICDIMNLEGWCWPWWSECIRGMYRLRSKGLACSLIFCKFSGSLGCGWQHRSQQLELNGIFRNERMMDGVMTLIFVCANVGAVLVLVERLAFHGFDKDLWKPSLCSHGRFMRMHGWDGKYLMCYDGPGYICTADCSSTWASICFVFLWFLVWPKATVTGVIPEWACPCDWPWGLFPLFYYLIVFIFLYMCHKFVVLHRGGVLGYHWYDDGYTLIMSGILMCYSREDIVHDQTLSQTALKGLIYHHTL